MADNNVSFLESLFNPSISEAYRLPAIDGLPSETKPAPVAEQPQPEQPAPTKTQAQPKQEAAQPAARGLLPTRADVIRRAQELDVDPALALSFFRAESSGNFNIRDSNKGAVGGFQVMPGTYKQMMGTADGMRDPWNNMEAGLRYMAYGQKTLGTRDPALLAAGYHAGYGRSELKRGEIPDTHDGLMSTRDYAKKVARSAGGGIDGEVRNASASRTAAADDSGRFVPLGADEIKRLGLDAGDDDATRYVPLSADEVAALGKDGAASSGVFTDIGKGLKVGINTAAQDLRELVGRVPLVGQPIVKGADAVDQYFSGKPSDQLLKDDSQQMTAQMSPSMQGALQKKWWDSDKGAFGPAWSDWRSYAGGLTQSLPEQALTMIPAMRLAKAAYTAKIAAGASAQVASQSAARTAMLTGSIAEGALGGAQSAREVRDTVLELKPEVLQQSEAYQALLQSGMQPEAAHKALAEDLSTRAFVTSGIATGMFGGMGDRAIAKIFTEQVGKSAVKNAIKGFGKGALAEGLFEELPQSGLQQLAQNEAVRKANPNQSLSDDVLNQALGGAAIGGLQGGGMGGGAALLNRNHGVAAPAPAAESKAGGPLTRAVEKVAEDQTPQPPRATVAGPAGEVSGTVQAYQEDGQGGFQAQIQGDDGQVYTFSERDGVQIAIEQPAAAGPLTSAVEKAAEGAAEPDVATAEPAPAVAAEAPTVAPAEPEPTISEQAAAQVTRPQVAERAKPEADLSAMSEPELRDRLKYIATQAKNTGGMNGMLIAERKRVEKEINARVEAAKAAPAAPVVKDSLTTAKPAKTSFDTIQDANAAMLAAAERTGTVHEVVEQDGKFKVKPIQESANASDERGRSAGPDVRVVPADGKRADADGHPAGERPAAAAEPGPQADHAAATASQPADQQPALAKKPKTISQADAEHLFGVDKKREAALKRIAKGTAFFGTKQKAKDYIAKNGLKDTHTVEQTGKVRFEVKAKVAEGMERFPVESGTLGVPRAEMPQVPTQSHGALVNHLNAQGIEHETKTVSASELKPTQEEFSPAKVEQAKQATGDRAVIVSNDGHIIDGHHQVLAAQEDGNTVNAIVLDAPVDQALDAVKNSPSAQQAAANDAAPAPVGKSLQTEANSDTAAPVPSAKAKPAVSQNTIFTEDAAAKARARLKAKLSQLNSGIDPEMMLDGVVLAGYHIEKGARTFSAFAKAMVTDLGEAVKPYLKSWYLAVAFDPRAAGLDGLTPVADVAALDLDAAIAGTAAAPAAKTETVSTPSGREFEVRHKVVEAADLITSNRDDGSINPAFPQDLQPRDRSRASSQGQVNDIASALNPRLLGESASATDGAPIVSAAGVVESGNGRTMAIRRAYQRDLAGAKKYRDWLASQGHDVTGMTAPVLVRERITKMSAAELRDYTREANDRTTLEMSPTERAMADAEKIGPILHLYQGGDIDAATSRDFVRAFVNDVAAKSDRGGLMDAHGILSQPGKRRIEAAMLAAAYDDAAVVADLFESADSDIKAIGGALLDASGAWAKMRDEARSGTISASVDVTPNLIEAVNLVRRARGEGRPIAEYVQQNDIFSGGLDPVTEGFVRLLYRGDNFARARSRDKVAGALKYYTDQARASQPGQNLFGDPEVSGADLLKATHERTQADERQADQQPDLAFGAQPDAPDAGRPGGEGRRPGSGAPRPAAPSGGLNVPDADAGVERDRGVAAAEPAVGDAVPAGAAATDDGAGDAGRRADGAGSGRADGARVSADGAAAIRERSDQQLFGGKRGASPAAFDAGINDGERSGDSGITGIPPDAIPATQVKRAATTGVSDSQKRREQQGANRLAVAPGLENIRATLPYLLDGQQEDVFKAETRFAKPDGYGMLFTNGTGTGKTFTGLGIVKRFERQGKRNILIVVPDDKIAADWIESGQALDLSIRSLRDTKDAGKGIVITSYANLGANDALAQRQWDMVLADEAHMLMQDKDGTPTSYLQNLRAITHHPDGAHTRFEMQNRALLDQIAALAAEGKELNLSAASTPAEHVKAKDIARRMEGLTAKRTAALAAVKADVDAKQGATRSRAVFLSATPFAYEKTIDWANGYLFDYNEGQPAEEGSFRGYNAGSNRERFFMQHLGYQMRYNKLTAPSDPKLDRGVLQRQFNGMLKKAGTLSGRMLDVPFDYDRRFIAVESAIGTRIDDALDWLSEHSRGNGADGVRALSKHISGTFDYLSRRYLLEAIKATEAVPIIRQHLALGRKVVVFHDYKKGGGFNPFNVNPQAITVDNPELAAAIGQAVADFRAEFKDLVGMPFERMQSPIETMRNAFPDVLLVNGDEKKADLLKRYKRFQDDASGPQVMLVQSAKNKGWSGHDTTGKHQRVLINLGQPTQPTLSIQQEGRVYRTGQASDAIFRYLNTGTNWEKWAFATTIATRASAAENLGMGELSRALKDAYISAFEESDTYPPGHDGEGKGGKQRDQASNEAITEYDRAKAFYRGTTKKNSKTKAQEGKDYFATPEPVGLKMVEWLDVQGGQDTLEPSGGHGAIARWLPENTNRTVIEPSLGLRSRMAMVLNGDNLKLIGGTFEDLHHVNKFDGIAMNPPFGVGGKTAIEHLAKAATHLRDGGRVVALIPTGPAADKRFAQWFDEAEERPLKPLGKIVLDGVDTPIYKGDTIASRASWAPTGVVVDWRDGAPMVRADGAFQGAKSLVSAESIKAVQPTGKRVGSFRPAENLHLVADIKLPSVTFERAGTAVTTRIVVIEKQADAARAPSSVRQRDLTGIDSINELFDRLENLTLPAREKAPQQAAAPAPAAPAKPTQAAVAAQPTRTVEQGAPDIITVKTKAGKELRGVIRADLTLAQAKQIDPYSWVPTGADGKKLAGPFIREKHLKNEDEDNSGARFSVAPEADDAGMLQRIAAAAELFQLPASDKTTVEGIAADNDSSITVKKLTGIPGETRYNFTLPDGNTARMVVRPYSDYGPALYGYDMVDGEMQAITAGRPGQNGEAMDGKDDVWIDVSLLSEGSGFGAKMYNIAATYAHNTGKVFIGDPAGLSNEALQRRPEMMLSSALKFGTTEHLAPHPRQVQGDPEVGVPPLAWVYGDHAGNIEKLAKVNLANIEHAGGIGGIRYNKETNTFEDSDGNPLTRADINDLGAVGLGRAAQAGGRTLARHALIQSLVQGEGGSGRTGRQPNVLLGAFFQLLRDHDPAELGSPLRRILYSSRPVSDSGRAQVAAAAEGAIASLMHEQAGEATVSHPELGTIAIPYGDQHAGLRHIANRRGRDFLNRIPALLASGKVYTKPGQNGRVFIGNERDEAAIRLDWNGQDKAWLLSAYEKYPGLKSAAPRSQAAQSAADTGLRVADLQGAITKGVLGPLVRAMVDSGVVVLHDTTKTLPKGLGRGVRGVQAVTAADGKVHLVASALQQDNARAVMLHELFHRGGERAIGSAQWGQLMGRLGSLYRQGEQSSGRAREFFDKARARVAAAKRQGAVATRMEVEEFAAYAIEEYESAPASVKKWVDDLIGLIKAWLVKRFGQQLGPVTPAQLAALAKMALMDVAADHRGKMFGPIGELFSVADPVDSPAFKRWFGNSKVVDADGKPLVVYHGTSASVTTFSGKMRRGGGASNLDKAGIYFTKDAALAARYGAATYHVYLKAENPLLLPSTDFPDVTSGQIFQDEAAEIQAAGYDAVMSGRVIVVFNPEQIKSAAGNNGEFDPANPDIRFSVSNMDAATADPSLLNGATAASPADQRPRNPVSDPETGFTPPEQGLARRLQSTVQDNMNRLKQVQNRISAVTGVKDLGKADYYLAETNRPGRVAARLEDAERQLTGPLMAKLAKSGHAPAQLEELLHAMHAEERNARVALINPQHDPASDDYSGVQGSGMNDEQAQEILAKYAGDKELHALAQQARDIARATLDLKHAYGLLDEAAYEALTKAYEYYVPLKGDGEFGPKVKRAMGHDEREEHILQNLARDYEQAVVVGEKNLARQSLLRLVLEFKDDALWTARVPPRGRYVAGQVYNIVHRGETVGSFVSRAQVDAFLEAKGDKAAQYDVLNSNGDRVQEFIKPLQDHEVMVYVNGEPIRLQFKDAKLAAQLRPLDQAKMHPILEFMRGMNRYLSKIYTGYNPAFILRNAARDAMTGTVNMLGNEGVGVAAAAWRRYPQAAAALARWAASGKTPDSQTGRYLTEYRMHGGKVGASWLSDLEEQGKTLNRMYEDAYGAAGYLRAGQNLKAAKVAGRKIVGGMAHVIEIGNQATENALRLSLFMALRERGASPGKAAQAAKQVTVDFDRKGTATGALGGIYLFFNPAVQGTANAFKTLTQGQYKGQAFAALGSLALLGLYAAAQGMDDDRDRWLGQGWDMRTRNFILHVGDKQIRVPLSQEFAPIYALGVALAEAGRGESASTTAVRLLSSFLDAYFPLNNAFNPDSDNHALDAVLAATPTLLQPHAQSAVNRNAFGSQIVPESEFTKDRPDNLKMYRSTKNSAYDQAAQQIAGIGELLGAGKYENDLSKISPETLKLMWRTYTGGLGQFVTDSIGVASMAATDASQLEASDWPIVKDFYRDADVKPIRSRYYDLAREAKAAATEFAQAKKAGDGESMDKILSGPKADVIGLGRLVKSTSKAAAALRDLEVDINADKSLTLAAKRAQLKALEQEEAALYRSAIAAFK